MTVEALHTEPLPPSGKPVRKAISKGQLLIGGKWVDAQAGETMDVVDPTTEASITHVQKASVGDANMAIDAAYAAFEAGPWGKLRHEDRAKILFRMADLMDERADDFAIREAMDMGMPYTDFRTIILPHCSGLFRFFAGQAMAHMDGGYRTSYETNIRAVGDALVKSRKVDKLAFTGSTTVGMNLIRNGADTIKRQTMELGGKSPNIIFADANMEAALQAAFWGIFWNKGEVCVAGSRILVERASYDEFVGKFSAMAKVAVLGDPLDPKTQLGPIATKPEYDKILNYIQAGKDSSARLTAGGGAPKIDGRGLFIKAAVFADATNDLKISREEIFGPVVPVIPFEGEDEAIRLADRIKAGTVWLNTWHKYHPNAPFGGYKASGYGREQGAEALENCTQYKTIWANPG